MTLRTRTEAVPVPKPSCLLERNWLFSSIGVQQQVLSTASAICPLSYRARMRIKGAISLHSPQTSSAFSRRFPRMEHNAGSLMERRFWKFETNGKVNSSFACTLSVIADNGINCIIFAPGPGSVWGKSHAVLFDIRFQILCFPAAQVILDHI